MATVDVSRALLEAVALTSSTSPIALLAGEDTPAKRASPVKLDPDSYYPEQAVAEVLGVSADTLRRSRWRGSGVPYCKYGRRIFYRGADLIAALDGSLRRSTSEEPGAALGA